MSFGKFSYAHLPTVHGEFMIYVLPEKIDLGTCRGRPAATFVEHYAMVPKGFDPKKPAAVYVHVSDLFADLFATGSKSKGSVPYEILERLGNGENGILLYRDQVCAAAWRMLREKVEQPKEYDAAPEQEVVNAFAKHLSIAKPEITHAPAKPKPSPTEPSVKVHNDLGVFDVRRKEEVVRVDFPAAMISSLFEGEPTAQPVFFKHLTHYALLAPGAAGSKTPLPVRIHSSCATGDLNSSFKCDCGPQFHMALSMVAEKGGVVVYHNAEGRGVLSLAAKMTFYRKSHEEGVDTYASMTSFGYPQDCRDYSAAAALLSEAGINEIILLTNNPVKIERVKQAGSRYGLKIVDTGRVIMDKVPEPTLSYLEAKKSKGGHLLGETGSG